MIKIFYWGGRGGGRGGGNSERCLKWGGGGEGVTTPVPPNSNHTLGHFVLSIALGCFHPSPVNLIQTSLKDLNLQS